MRFTLWHFDDGKKKALDGQGTALVLLLENNIDSADFRSINAECNEKNNVAGS